ncbi:unnamed protein product [Moneuplotes crassus]|uniref:Uncharacterized protein n=1 Tax=Euplotes crassus TaxID=5936 RepID=A0AAD1U2E8_EUPCR|nr:unnamed protein product [Moneuplotes crassus]
MAEKAHSLQTNAELVKADKISEFVIKSNNTLTTENTVKWSKLTDTFWYIELNSKPTCNTSYRSIPSGLELLAQNVQCLFHLAGNSNRLQTATSNSHPQPIGLSWLKKQNTSERSMSSLTILSTKLCMRTTRVKTTSRFRVSQLKAPATHETHLTILVRTQSISLWFQIKLRNLCVSRESSGKDLKSLTGNCINRSYSSNVRVRDNTDEVKKQNDQGTHSNAWHCPYRVCCSDAHEEPVISRTHCQRNVNCSDANKASAPVKVKSKTTEVELQKEPCDQAYQAQILSFWPCCCFSEKDWCS